jgi:subtilase family serine protease
MSGTNEISPNSGLPNQNDGLMMPLFEDPFKQGTGTSPTSPIGSPSTDLPVIDTHGGEISGVEPLKPDQIFPNQKSTTTSTPNIDPITGSAPDDPLVGILNSDSFTQNIKPVGGETTTKTLLDDITKKFSAPASPLVESLTPAILEKFRHEAIARWTSLGLGEFDTGILNNVQLAIADLPGLKLGLASGNIVTIDVDAAGAGWFIDGTPGDDVEFSNVVGASELQATQSDPAFGKVDLLTILTHEFGHILGLEHVGKNVQPEHLMSPSLPLGARRLPILENLNFAQTENPQSSFSSLAPGAALSFDGVDDYVQLGNSAIAANQTNSTVEMWVRLNQLTTTGQQTLYSEDSSGGSIYQIYYANGNLGFAIWRSDIWSNWKSVSAPFNTANEWVHIAAVLDQNAGMLLYINGTMASSSADKRPSDASVISANLGKVSNQGGSGYLDGQLDSLRVWNVARTQADIQANMGKQLSGNEPGLVGDWNFDEGLGSTVSDKTANRNGTLGGGIAANQPVWTTTVAPSNPQVIPSFYRNTVLADTPIGYWSLDELNWPVIVDSGGNGHSGSLNGVTLGTEGSVGNAASFNNANDTIEIPINSPETNYTYELWFKTKVATGGISSVRQGINYADDRDLYLKDGNIYHYLWSGERIGSNDKNYADDKWHHVAVVVQSGVGQKLYVDSELVASGTKDKSNFNWDTYLTLGKAYESGGQGFSFPSFNGSLDEVALYDSALSADQIRVHYVARAIKSGAFPDLAVTNITSGTTVTWGQNIPISWTVTNQSGAITSATWSDRVYLSADTTLDSSDTVLATFSKADQASLMIGSSYTLSGNVVIPNTIDPSKTWYLLFQTDANVEQIETDKANNVLSVPLNLSIPNLVYSNNFESAVGSEWSTTEVNNSTLSNFSAFLGRFNNSSTSLKLDTIPGTTYRLEFDFYAIDSWDGASYDYDEFNIFVDNNQVFNQTFPNESFRSPDQSDSNLGFSGWPDRIYRRIPLVFTATGTTTQIRFADGGLQGFSDESWGIDNVKVWTVETNAAQPDLVVTNITPPVSAAMNETIAVTWTVKNQGTGTAENSWLDRVYISKNNTIDSTAISLGTASAANLTPLPESGTYRLSEKFVLPNNIIGDWNLLVATDTFKNQIESNENNNVSSTPLHIKAADLVVTDAKAPASASERSKISLEWTVENQGEATASSRWYDYVYLSDNTILDNSDRLLDNVLIDTQMPLAIGKSYTVKQEMTLPSQVGSGKQYLLFVTDRHYWQIESSDTNNVRALSIDITVPDLVVKGVTAPIAAPAGGTVEVSWTVENQGSVQATHSWYDRVYLSNDQTLDREDTLLGQLDSGTSGTTVDPQKTYTLTKDITIPNKVAGNRYLLFVADAGNNQYETNEKNNVWVAPLQVNAPDLIVSEVSAPTVASLGEQIIASWQVTNQSNFDAGADWYDYVYLSDDNIYDNSDQYITEIRNQAPLTSRGNYWREQNITIPTGVKPGERYLLFVTDEKNDQGETDENNNVTAASINIKAPDLVVSDARIDASVDPTLIVPGSTLSLSYTVKNQGKVTTTNNWLDNIYLSNDAIYDNSDSQIYQHWRGVENPLATDDTYTVKNIDVTLPNNAVGQPGSRYLLFVTNIA